MLTPKMKFSKGTHKLFMGITLEKRLVCGKEVTTKHILNEMCNIFSNKEQLI